MAFFKFLRTAVNLFIDRDLPPMAPILVRCSRSSTLIFPLRLNNGFLVGVPISIAYALIISLDNP